MAEHRFDPPWRRVDSTTSVTKMLLLRVMLARSAE
jgi:hypothetical protein